MSKLQLPAESVVPFLVMAPHVSWMAVLASAVPRTVKPEAFRLALTKLLVPTTVLITGVAGATVLTTTPASVATGLVLPAISCAAAVMLMVPSAGIWEPVNRADQLPWLSTIAASVLLPMVTLTTDAPAAEPVTNSPPFLVGPLTKLFWTALMVGTDGADV